MSDNRRTVKTIFIFNDGTGQSLGSKNLSNVAKIYQALQGTVVDSDLKADQVKTNEDLNYHSYYYRGVGTEDSKKDLQPAGTKKTFWTRVWDFVKEKLNLGVKIVIGTEIKDRVESMLVDIIKTWRPGDKLYLIGFSRGAAGVRITAHLLKKKLENVQIEYLLVFDTVYSVFAPIKILDFEEINFFNNIDIGSHIISCDHLIAGDEMRSAFPVTLVNYRLGVRQILFSGSHSDIGGGAIHSKLSDITLDFSFKQLIAMGIQFDAKYLANLKTNPDPTAEINWDKFNGTGQEHYPRNLSEIDFQIHQSVKTRIDGNKSAPIALSQLVSFHMDANELVDVSSVFPKMNHKTSQSNHQRSPDSSEIRTLDL